jgi:transposase IS200 family protein
MAPPTIAPADIAKFLKSESSLWIHKMFPSLKKFSWQDGYAAFTVSESNIPRLIRYIKNRCAATELNMTNDTLGMKLGHVATRLYSCMGLGSRR